METFSEYDPHNFRLKRIRSVRQRDGRVLQDQRYTYDAAGNTIHVADAAQQAVFFNNTVVEPDRHFVYDALHRLVEASGREHAQVPTGPQEHELPPRGTIPSDLQALRRYTRRYAYDVAANITEMRHVVPGGAGSGMKNPSQRILRIDLHAGLLTAWTMNEKARIQEFPVLVPYAGHDTVISLHMPVQPTAETR